MYTMIFVEAFFRGHHISGTKLNGITQIRVEQAFVYAVQFNVLNGNTA